MRFGNDEIKPNDMKEDAKWKEDRAGSGGSYDSEINQQNACRSEQQVFYNCLNDKKDNIDLCQEAMDGLRDCERHYAWHFTRTNNTGF